MKKRKFMLVQKETLNSNKILLSKMLDLDLTILVLKQKVVFNRTEQTANSKSKSLFKAKNTIISSDGFNIFDKVDKIVFYGKSFIVLK